MILSHNDISDAAFIMRHLAQIVKERTETLLGAPHLTSIEAVTYTPRPARWTVLYRANPIS